MKNSEPMAAGQTFNDPIDSSPADHDPGNGPLDQILYPYLNETPAGGNPLDEPSPLADLIGTPEPFESAPAVEPQASPPMPGFLGFFGLRINPFSDSVNPEFFYKTDAHDEAFIRMSLAIENEISLGLVTGISGTGKTLISQLLLRNMDPAKYAAVLVLVSPNMSKTALLREILSELEIEIPADMISTQEMLKLLSHQIIDLYEKGRKLVILVDECHFLSAESLHLIRTISNIEIPEKKLSTTILFGEQRFMKRLEHPSYESIRNRMYLRSELPPLSAADCAQYVKFRLLVAGRDAELFDDNALSAIALDSGGICRRINKLCMLSLLEAYRLKQPIIGEPVISLCAKEL